MVEAKCNLGNHAQVAVGLPPPPVSLSSLIRLMRILIVACICCLHAAAASEKFLTFSKAELCEAEPHLNMCRHRAMARAVKSVPSRDLAETREDKSEKQGFIPVDDPFEEIGTRPPPLSESSHRSSIPKKHFRDMNDYYRYRYQEYQQQRQSSQNALLYRVYPSMHPKDGSYCPNMRGMFAYTCQPSKPLRLDLVEFCKDYSVFCDVPNFHRLPGPRMGPPISDNGFGHVGVNGKFGFAVGSVPGLDVGVGWGVDVGPLPGLGESVGVGLGLDLGVMGAKTPEAYRRGQDNPNEKGGGIFGISGGVGVKAPGTGNIGVGSGIGVGK